MYVGKRKKCEEKMRKGDYGGEEEKSVGMKCMVGRKKEGKECMVGRRKGVYGGEEEWSRWWEKERSVWWEEERSEGKMEEERSEEEKGRRGKCVW